MRVIGTVTMAQLAEIARRGVDAKDAVDMTLAEAKKRHPGSTVVFRKRPDGSAFDLVAL